MFVKLLRGYFKLQVNCLSILPYLWKSLLYFYKKKKQVDSGKSVLAKFEANSPS